MTLAWILLLLQVYTPALPRKGQIVCWRNEEHNVVCVNSLGEYVPVPARPPVEPKAKVRAITCPQGEICMTIVPMDVPAVSTNRWVTLTDVKLGGVAEDLYHEICLDTGRQYSAEQKACLTTHWDCADKTRVLLTSEDGKKHCVKFPKE